MMMPEFDNVVGNVKVVYFENQFDRHIKRS
jgi:hypothetical protein